MTQEEIKNIIPHRSDMLLVEEAEIIDGTAIGKYTVKGNEFFLNGHFPDNPVVPGVILCEMMAQASCVLLSDVSSDDFTPFFTGLNNVKFRNPVKPGDTFESRCIITKVKAPFYFAQAKGYVNGKLCTSAEFSFALIRK